LGGEGKRKKRVQKSERSYLSKKEEGLGVREKKAESKERKSKLNNNQEEKKAEDISANRLATLANVKGRVEKIEKGSPNGMREKRKNSGE